MAGILIGCGHGLDHCSYPDHHHRHHHHHPHSRALSVWPAVLALVSGRVVAVGNAVSLFGLAVWGGLEESVGVLIPACL